MRRRTKYTLFVLTLAVGAGGVRAQTPRGIILPSAERRLAEGDRLHEMMKPLEALQSFQRALAQDQDSYEALWKSAREAVNLGMLAADDDARDEWYRTAADYARRALEARPGGSEGHQWLAVALGRIALAEGPRTRVRMATDVRNEALAALEADSTNAGAHHVLGRWHAEIMRLSGLTRFVARELLGGDVMGQASWERAEEHLRTAISFAPETLIHRLELARILDDTDRPEEAREQLRQVLELPSKEPTDPLHKQEAQELLRELG